MDRTELARARAATLNRRPAEVLRAEPLTLTAVRAVPRPVVPAPGRLAHFRAWRREHYVADQALRVLAILAGLATVLALLVGAGWALFHFYGDSIAAFAGACAALGVLAVVIVLAAAASSKPDHSGDYGFHWSKCKR